MPYEVIMPQMGESIFEGTILRWLKKPGERVRKDEPLFEISTDKIDTEVPSPAEGTLLEIKVAEGQAVPVRTVVALIGEADAAAASPAAPPPARTAAAAPPPPPAAHQPSAAGPVVPAPAAQESAAAVPPPPAPPSPATTSPAVAKPAPGATSTPAESRPDGARILTSPLVRRIAKEHGLDLREVPGTGWRNRITKKDIEEYIARKKAAPQAAQRIEEKKAAPAPAAGPMAPVSAPAAAAAATPLVPAEYPPSTSNYEIVPMSPMRARIADHMIMSRRTSAHVTTVWEVDVTDIVRLREREKDDYERVYGTKLTYTPFFAFAAVRAITDFPYMNAQVRGREIVLHRDINLGIAVAVRDGLIVPVVRNAEEKSFLGLCRAINDVAERARTKRLTVEDVQGGTFTITNPGVFGSLFGTPIINQPQVAILGIGAIVKRPVVRDGAIAIRDIVHLALSFDHRIIDGADADRFMARVREILEGWDIPIK